MIKNIKLYTINFFIFIYLLLLFTMPAEIFRFGYSNEIFPATDLIVIYYLSTIRTISIWQLFIIGAISDIIYNMPLGTNMLALILGNFFLIMLNNWFIVKDYIPNIIIFCGYSLFIMTIRYLIITVKSSYYIEGNAIYFCYLTTILSYPTMKIFTEIPFKIFR